MMKWCKWRSFLIFLPMLTLMGWNALRTSSAAESSYARKGPIVPMSIGRKISYEKGLRCWTMMKWTNE